MWNKARLNWHSTLYLPIAYDIDYDNDNQILAPYVYAIEG